MNRTVSKNGKIVVLCNYEWTDPDGKISRCNAPKSCPVCGQCSRIDKDREHGHCTGHLGLEHHIPVPGNDAFLKMKKEQR